MCGSAYLSVCGYMQKALKFPCTCVVASVPVAAFVISCFFACTVGAFQCVTIDHLRGKRTMRSCFRSFEIIKTLHHDAHAFQSISQGVYCFSSLNSHFIRDLCRSFCYLIKRNLHLSAHVVLVGGALQCIMAGSHRCRQLQRRSLDALLLHRESRYGNALWCQQGDEDSTRNLD